jgi:hypothetical protein
MKYSEDRPTCVFDVECVPNCFIVSFKEIGGKGRVRTFMRYEWDGEVVNALDRAGIAQIFRKWRIVGFNSRHYDLPIVLLAMTDADCGALKRASDAIISTNLKHWEFENKYGVSVPGYTDHIDLIDVAPGVASLKIYGAVLHSKRMQDMPFEHWHELEPDEVPVMLNYNVNDLDTTIDLWNELQPQITLRNEMSEEFGLDVRSKSDAQVAEAVIKKQIEQQTGRRIYKPDPDWSLSFGYRPPKWMQFQHPALRDMFQIVRSIKFRVGTGYDGSIALPSQLEGLELTIGNGVYRMGIGGLHSSEKSKSYYSDDEYQLCDVDVSSYYPRILIDSQMSPPACGPLFQQKYKGHFDVRIAAKKKKLKKVANSRKIMLNGTFGKTGSPFSIFYSPELMIYVTITGQLALLMLIEQIEAIGISVISANTDGVVSLVPKERYAEFWDAITAWEAQTGFDLEETRYRSIHSRDVNNYIAIVDDSEHKAKGAYAKIGFYASGYKSPKNEVCNDAVVDYLRRGTPLRDSIEGCTNIRKFVTAQKVNGGAMFGDEMIGKAIRWYYSTEISGSFKRKDNGNTVNMTMGAKPCLELPDELPDDIDYDWYVREAQGILHDIGMEVPDDDNPNRRQGRALAHRPGQKTMHTIDLYVNRALCGDMLKQRHDKWVEHTHMPEGHRECSRCVKAIGGL